MRYARLINAVIFSLMAALLAIFLFRTPSNDRNWAADQQVLAYAEPDAGEISIFNIRNITYRSTDDYDVNYYNASYHLNNLSSLYFILEPFKGEWDGAAHTFLSFGFDDGRYLAISVEIRKEVGESFSAIKGLFRNYEIMYVIADERDVIKLRSNFRGDDVYVYPINTTQEKMRMLFMDMITRANKLKNKPEFYNTLTDTCTTNIVTHVNRIAPSRIPFSFKTLAPGFSDELAYNLGLINTTLSLKEAREYYRINDRALKYANSSDFSNKIREPMSE